LNLKNIQNYIEIKSISLFDYSPCPFHFIFFCLVVVGINK
jgi:hypothetical protein